MDQTPDHWMVSIRCVFIKYRSCWFIFSVFSKQRPSYCCYSRIVPVFGYKNDNIRVKISNLNQNVYALSSVLFSDNSRVQKKILFSSCVENWNRAKWPQIKLSAHKHGLIFDWIERRGLNLRISKVMVNFLAQSIAVIDPPLLRSYEWMSCAAHARSPRKFINKHCVQCGSRDRALQQCFR